MDADQERRIRPDLGGHVPKLEDGPWPAFPADVMSTTIVTATQCEGMLLVFEKMFESRLFFVDKLIGMGARIVLCDPHRAVISGPSPLKGGTVESPDIRAGMAMLLAALAAEGTSTIHNVGQIERGYERIDERLRALGADIERVGLMTASRLSRDLDAARRARRGPVPRFELPGWRRARCRGRHHRPRHGAGVGFDLGLWTDAAGGRGDESLAGVPQRGKLPGFDAVMLGNQVHGDRVVAMSSGAAGFMLDGVDGHVTDNARAAAHGDGGGLHSGLPARARHGGRAAPRRVAGHRRAGSWARRGSLLRPRWSRCGDILMHCGVGICGRML